MSAAATLIVDRFRAEDFDAVVRIDAAVSGAEKRAFWRDYLGRSAANPNNLCLVVREGDEVTGFLVGEIRAHEFGQQPSGWVLALGVQPARGRQGHGRQLLARFCEWLRANGVTRVRTMVTHDQVVVHRFFRSRGFTAGPYIQLELELS